MVHTMRIALTRPLPGDFLLPDCPDAEIRTGPERGFASREDLYRFVHGASAIVSWVSERVDAELLDHAGDHLRIVNNFAVGYDNIDLNACRKRNIVVCNTPDAVTDGTADVAILLMLAAARRLAEGDHYARSGTWAREGVLGPRDFMGQPVSGRTLLIVGAGRIGYQTALRMIGWGMRTLYVARSPKPDFEHPPLNARRVDLDEGLAEADFVSLHTPLTPETRHLIDARRLALMKPTAILVNTARGPVVDEAALADALRDKRIFAAGLDVFENEPKVHPDLTALDNVVMLPHIGSANWRGRAQMTALCADNINRVLSGKPARTQIA